MIIESFGRLWIQGSCVTDFVYDNMLFAFLLADVIWVILSVEVGGLLGVTQQLSSFQAEFNTQPHRRLEGDYNPFASPEKSKCPNSNSLHDASGHRVAEERWQGRPDELQQDQNGLSHTSVDIVANSLQSNLSVVSYNQVRHIKGEGIVKYGRGYFFRLFSELLL